VKPDHAGWAPPPFGNGRPALTGNTLSRTRAETAKRTTWGQFPKQNGMLTTSVNQTTYTVSNMTYLGDRGRALTVAGNVVINVDACGIKNSPTDPASELEPVTNIAREIATKITPA
jgi:hypothetical protein